jgi:pimeloyl-ACP methyl ester carboxylesterase
MKHVPTPCLLLLVALAWLITISTVNAESSSACRQQAADACYFHFQPKLGGGQMHYYASQSPTVSGQAGPTSAVIVVHGHPRDANTIFNAAQAAVASAGDTGTTVVIAPVFQVAPDEAGKCSTAGVPAAQSGDLLWTCASWIDGGQATDAPNMTSFTAMDALIAEVKQQWPSVRVVTVAGFSAGAQMVQHYIGFASTGISEKIAIRYVVADPGTWLYFDKVRPVADSDVQTMDASNCADTACRFQLVPPNPACRNVNLWKYGTDALPLSLNLSAAQARMRYTHADIRYIEAALDSGSGKGTSARILDKSCAAEAQGSYRLQRGLAYAAYDRQQLAPAKHRRVVVIPNCAHDVACVFASPDIRAALLAPSH